LSAGLGVFMSFIEEIRAAGGDIKICGLAPKVFQVFDILGFPALFDILPDLPAAFQRFQEAPVKET
jgi:anti-sigma B factor antagonist